MQNYRKSGPHSSRKPFPPPKDPVTSEVLGDPYYFRAEGAGGEDRFYQLHGNFYGKGEPKTVDRSVDGMVVDPYKTIISP